MPSVDPPEPVLCLWCDGLCTVEVHAITDIDGVVHEVSHYNQEWSLVTCPRCRGEGEEPELDPYDDPALDDKIKERRHGLKD